MFIVRSPIEFPEQIREGDHLVQFYKNESHLAETVSNFAAPALMSGEAVLIIATAEHLREFEKSLSELYLNTGFLKLTKQLLFLETEELITKFMLGDKADNEQFISYVSDLLQDMKRQFASVKVYSEIMSELWKKGNVDATLQFEKLWSSLQKDHSFSLLCAYSLDSLSEEKQGIIFSEICQCHTHVIPAEGIIETDNHKEQLRRIAELQFKISSQYKSFHDWKVNTLEMMIPLAALKLYLREINFQSDVDLRSLVLKCEHQIDRMSIITERLSKTTGNFL